VTLPEAQARQAAYCDWADASPRQCHLLMPLHLCSPKPALFLARSRSRQLRASTSSAGGAGSPGNKFEDKEFKLQKEEDKVAREWLLQGPEASQTDEALDAACAPCTHVLLGFPHPMWGRLRT
jgi:hypothetical protein